MAVDYGHWDATLQNCVGLVAENSAIEPEYAARLLSTNTLEFYGDRLKRRVVRIAPSRNAEAPLEASA
jgi:hypothetical protein